MTQKENFLRTVRFEKPDYIPMSYCISAAYFTSCDQDRLFEAMERHPRLFPCFKKPELPFVPNYSPIALKNKPFTDDFGCVWETSMDGITGTVKGHPLENWEDFDSWTPPDPNICTGIGPINWDDVKKWGESSSDRIFMGGLRHGHTFLQLSDLRGYENLMYDMADEEPRLFELIEKVEAFNLGIVNNYIACGVDGMGYAEDLGMQIGPMLSPEHFRKYIKPSYKRLMQPARDKDLVIHMHSDGDIRTLLDDIIEGGVEIMNLQDLVNGIDWIKEKLRGKVCIELDVDRQNITCFGTPREVDDLIRREVETLGSPDGGLMMVYGLYPGTPIENAIAVMDAMEKYMGYYR
ncbi:MAG: hypothetical protein IKZ19_09150 [Clostridia bacterium]|nr:hypothetical protein [Clostridia bacterium]